MGARRQKTKWRDIDGVLLLNKPIGVSSNHALQRVRRLFQAAKAGHTGTLDPLATGLLPICFGDATKFSQYLLSADKRYEFTLRLGEVTATGDAEGEVLTRSALPQNPSELLKIACNALQGEIDQVPPMYSALKHQGKRLYELARQGIEVERPARRVTIHSLEIVSESFPDVMLRVHCSKGTYVRSLAVDIGEALGCGAHVTRLHRTSVGGFSGGSMIDMGQLESIQADQGAMDLNLLHPMSDFLRHLPKQTLLAESVARIQRGQPAVVPPGLDPNQVVCLYCWSQCFLGVGVMRDGQLHPKRLCRMT